MSQQPDRARSYFVEWFLSAALVMVTLLVYCPTFDYPFIGIDDPDYVTQNPHVQAGLNAQGIGWAFTTFHSANWHPLTWMSLQLDATIHGARAGGFHMTNVALHTVNTLLLFLVLGSMTGAVWRSVAVAALFALHPLHVESVAWVTERKDVLSTLFWMLTLAAYAWYVRQPSILRYLPVALALALGLLAKPMLVTLPCVLLLLDYWPLRRWRPESKSPEVSFGRLLAEKVPLFVLVLASCAVTALAQRQAVGSFERFPLDARIGNAVLSYVGYLGKLLWPVHLAVYYPHARAAVPLVPALGAGMLLLVVTVLVLRLGRRWPYLAVGWLWYLGTLVPVIGLVQVGSQGMADRYTYVPAIGLFIMAAWGVADLALAARVPRPVLAMACAAVLVGCVALTWEQEGYWSQDLYLWEHAAAVTDRNAVAHANYGAQLWRLGRPEEAKAQFREAIASNPTYAAAHTYLGTALRSEGKLKEATEEYRQSAALDSHSANVHNNFATLLRDQARLEEAAEEYQKALALDPALAHAHLGLGAVLRDLGRADEAANEFRRAAELDPALGQAHGALGQILLEQGRYREAEASTRRARDLLAPDDPLYAPLSRQLERCRRLPMLELRLPRILNGEAEAASTEEWLELAWLCQSPRQRRHAAAARCYASAFAADPELAVDVHQQRRTRAARAAALAGVGDGVDAAALDDDARARLRTQARDWLQADVRLCAKRAHSDQPADRVLVFKMLRIWQHDPALAGVRDPSALAKLPAPERAAWQTLWQEIDGVASALR